VAEAADTKKKKKKGKSFGDEEEVAVSIGLRVHPRTHLTPLANI